MNLLDDGSRKIDSNNNVTFGDLIASTIDFSDFIKGEIVEIHRQRGEKWMVQSHFDILQLLHDDGDLTMSQLADRVSRTSPTVTTLVKRLKKNGYLETYKMPEDERIIRARLTDKGLVQAEWAKETLADYQNALSGRIDSFRVMEAVQLLDDIKNILDAMKSEAKDVTKD